MMMKRILAGILVLVLALGLAATGFAEAPKGRLVILHTNDNVWTIKEIQ